jgi:hypothetical protein
VNRVLQQPVELVPARGFHLLGLGCALSVNEETKDQARTPGRAAVTSTVLLVAILAIVTMAALAFAGPAFLAKNSSRPSSRSMDRTRGSSR